MSNEAKGYPPSEGLGLSVEDRRGVRGGRVQSASEQMGNTAGAQPLSPSAGDPYARLGVGAVLAMLDTEEEIARITAGALTEVLSVPLGVLVLRSQADEEVRVVGQYEQKCLEGTLAVIQFRLVCRRQTTDNHLKP